MHRHHISHLFLLLLLVLPLIVLVIFTANINTNQSLKTEAQNLPSGTPATRIIAKNLNIPWAIAFLPDGNMLVTERPGTVKLIAPANGQTTDIVAITGVKATGEGGLLGIALHPQFASNNFVYLYYTYQETSGNTLNRVVRYVFSNNQMTSPTTIVDAIPGGTHHDEGRIKIGPDGILYITTGDAGNPSSAQDTNSLAGKILRVTDTGQPAPGNPFNNRTYSYGNRNPQGLTWNGSTFYATEHGNSSPSRSDELNLIEAGKNYGWPTIEGDAQQTGMVTPLVHSGNDATTTWAPAGTAFFNDSIFFGGLKGQALYEAKVQGTTASIVNQHFKGQFGRIREVIVGPDNQLYITTSNRDGRGTPQAEDDKIIRVNFAANSAPTSAFITPTYGVIAPCPSCGVTSPIPSSASTNPQPSSRTTTPSVSTQPCVAEGASIAHNKKKKSKHKQKSGGVSKFMDALLRFLIELLNLLLRLIGGGTTPLPNPQPTPSTVPDPCAPTSAPTSAPVPTINPSVPVVSPSVAPIIAPSTPVSVAPSITQPFSVAPSAAPTQVFACIPSGQKCDATGARKCCTNACVHNINPNYPDDPGTCD